MLVPGNRYRLRPMSHRVERIVLETENHRVVGDLSLPRDGYLSRLSDYLNREELVFVSLVNATITPRNGGAAEQREFVTVARQQIHLA